MVGGSDSTEGFGRRALVESGNGILNRTKLRFVYAESSSRLRRQWSSDERSGKASQTAIDSTSGSQNLECLLTAPTTLYTGLGFH
jgi:hypothetical protein